MNGSATARISMAAGHARGDADLLERVLQRQRVDDGGEHAHVVGRRAVHALRAGGEAAEQVAAADDDGGLDAELLDFADLLGDLGGDGGIDPEGLFAHEGFAGEFEEDARSGRTRDHRTLSAFGNSYRSRSRGFEGLVCSEPTSEP